MTVLDLCSLIRRHLALVVALPIVCAVACFGYFSIPQDQAYTAQARIIVNSQMTGVVGLASSGGRMAVEQHPGVTVEAKGESATNTVTITATSANADECIIVANEVAQGAARMAEQFYRGNENPFEGHVEEAISADAKSKSKLKYTLIALLAGLFVAICIVVIIDMVRRPVKSIVGVQDAVELPVLEVLPVSDGGERLLANVRFASKRDSLQSVCVVPVGDAMLSSEVCDLLVSAEKTEGKNAEQSEEVSDTLITIAGDSFARGMSAAYAARETDAVVIAVRQWSDSLTGLGSVVNELKLAGANLVGIVFAREKK